MATIKKELRQKELQFWLGHCTSAEIDLRKDCLRWKVKDLFVFIQKGPINFGVTESVSGWDFWHSGKI